MIIINRKDMIYFHFIISQNHMVSKQSHEVEILSIFQNIGLDRSQV